VLGLIDQRLIAAFVQAGGPVGTYSWTSIKSYSDAFLDTHQIDVFLDIKSYFDAFLDAFLDTH